MSYKDFKAELAKLCERGRITKDTKKAFSHYPETTSPSILIYSVCSDLLVLFGKSKENSAEYGSVSAAAVELISELGGTLDGFSRDVATLCAYITLTQKANAGDKAQFDKLKKHSADFNRSLQNIRYGLPLF